MCHPASITKWTPSNCSLPGSKSGFCEINSIRACLAWTASSAGAAAAAGAMGRTRRKKARRKFNMTSAIITHPAGRYSRLSSHLQLAEPNAKRGGLAAAQSHLLSTHLGVIELIQKNCLLNILASFVDLAVGTTPPGASGRVIFFLIDICLSSAQKAEDFAEFAQAFQTGINRRMIVHVFLVEHGGAINLSDRRVK